MMASGACLYLSQTNESVKCGDPVYAVGQTMPVDSVLWVQVRCIEPRSAEKSVLTRFHKKYHHAAEHGDNQFRGAILPMMRDLFEVCVFQLYGGFQDHMASSADTYGGAIVVPPDQDTHRSVFGFTRSFFRWVAEFRE
jgi:hypothetical protein